MNNSDFDNHTLRLVDYSRKNKVYIIIALRDGVRKYVSKDFGCKGAFHYSVKINNALKFSSVKTAERFIEDYRNSKFELSDPEIYPAIVETKIELLKEEIKNDNK